MAEFRGVLTKVECAERGKDHNANRDSSLRPSTLVYLTFWPPMSVQFGVFRPIRIVYLLTFVSNLVFRMSTFWFQQVMMTFIACSRERLNAKLLKLQSELDNSLKTVSKREQRVFGDVDRTVDAGQNKSGPPASASEFSSQLLSLSATLNSHRSTPVQVLSEMIVNKR